MSLATLYKTNQQGGEAWYSQPFILLAAALVTLVAMASVYMIAMPSSASAASTVAVSACKKKNLTPKVVISNNTASSQTFRVYHDSRYLNMSVPSKKTGTTSTTIIPKKIRVDIKSGSTFKEIVRYEMKSLPWCK